MTHKEKDEFARNSEAYEKYLLQDEETVQILTHLLDGHFEGLDTPEKRACWRAGFELGGSSIIFTSKSSNTSLAWRAIAPNDIDLSVSEYWRSDNRKNATDNDSYYYTLGAIMHRRAK